MSRRQIQKGFTLIELVVVITILGILAAVALPRFTDLQSQARTAKAQALLGSVRAAAANVKAVAVVNAVSCSATPASTPAPVASVEGSSITLNYCYPTADTNGIIAAANISATNDSVTVVAGNPIALEVQGAPTAANCSVTYKEPTVAGGAPTIAVVTTGC